MKESLLYLVSGLLVWSSPASAIYISWKSKEDKAIHQKTNQIYPVKKQTPAFKSDKDISRYLKLYGQEAMLWRCKNAIQPYWDWKPISMVDSGHKVGGFKSSWSSVELYCEVIGVIDNLQWFHNGEKLQLGGRFGQTIIPHYAGGQYYAKWINFRLKIYGASSNDSGIYTFRITGIDGKSEEQTIYVDISEKKKKKRRKDRKGKKRLRRRRRMRQLRTARLNPQTN